MDNSCFINASEKKWGALFQLEFVKNMELYSVHLQYQEQRMVLSFLSLKYLLQQWSNITILSGNKATVSLIRKGVLLGLHSATELWSFLMLRTKKVIGMLIVIGMFACPPYDFKNSLYISQKAFLNYLANPKQIWASKIQEVKLWMHLNMFGLLCNFFSIILRQRQ